MNINEQHESKIRLQILSLFLAVTAILLCYWGVCEVEKEIQNRKIADLKWQITMETLTTAEIYINQAEQTIENFDILEAQVRTYTQDLEVASSKLEEVEETSEVLENTEESQMRPIYEEAENKLKEAMTIIHHTDIASIQEDQAEIANYMTWLCHQAKANLLIAKDRLENGNQNLYTRYRNLRRALEKIQQSMQKNTKSVEEQISDLETQNMSVSIASEPLITNLEDFEEIIEEYEAFEEMKKSLEEKLVAIEITEELDMSKPIGFTEEELQYLLQSSGQISDEDITAILPIVMVNTVQEYPVNELFSLSVMSLESGYFSTYLAVNKNNFGGLLNSNGTGLTFSSKKEGIEAAIKCLHNNLRGDNTIHEINARYCPDGSFHWSDDVLSIMRSYRNSVIS